VQDASEECTGCIQVTARDTWFTRCRVSLISGQLRLHDDAETNYNNPLLHLYFASRSIPRPKKGLAACLP